MRGFAWIEKQTRLKSLYDPAGLGGLVLCLSVGVVAGLIASHARLHLRLPGHKVILWMTPVIIARLSGRFKFGATTGAIAAAITSLSVGGDLARNPLDLLLVGAAGVVLDVMISRVQKSKIPILVRMPVIAVAAMLANLILLGRKLFGAMGAGGYMRFTGRELYFRLLSYSVFGLISGILAVVIVYIGWKTREKIKRRTQ